MLKNTKSLLHPARPRRGAAAAELACVLPLFVTLVLGTIEVGRGIMVTQALSNAARKGARMAIYPLNDNATVAANTLSVLRDNGIHTAGAQVTIHVNDSVGEVKAARPGDKISVTVAVPLARTSWLASGWYGANDQVFRTVTMRHQ